MLYSILVPSSVISFYLDFSSHNHLSKCSLDDISVKSMSNPLNLPFINNYSSFQL